MKIGDRSWIVTGASRGIGAAIARALASEGAHVVLNARSEQRLREVAALCEAEGVKTAVVAGDCGDEGVVKAMVEAARGLAPLGGFVHDAAVARPGPLLWEMEATDVAAVLDSNVVAGFHLARHALPVMDEGCAAVLLGSGAAVGNVPGLGAYCVAKAAEEHLARQIAAERPDLLAFVYRPGVVDTAMQEEARDAEGGSGDSLRAMFRGYRDQGMLTTPDEVARILVDALRSPSPKLRGGMLDARG